MAMVKVRVPFGTSTVILFGMRYDADPYGFVEMEERLAMQVCKSDKRFKLGAKRAGVADVTADSLGADISNDVAKQSAQAENRITTLIKN